MTVHVIDLGTALRESERAVDVTEAPSAAAENAPTTAPGLGSTAHSGSLESRITQAWDDLAEIAEDARCSYDSEGYWFAMGRTEVAMEELQRIQGLLRRAERNAEPRA